MYTTFGMGDKLEEINRANIRIAREAATEFSTSDRPRFVIGSIGPGTKMPSLTDPGIYADFDRLANAYRRQLQILIEERAHRRFLPLAVGLERRRPSAHGPTRLSSRFERCSTSK